MMERSYSGAKEKATKGTSTNVIGTERRSTRSVCGSPTTPGGMTSDPENVPDMLQEGTRDHKAHT